MNSLSLAARNLGRRPTRTGLTIASVSLAVAAFVALTTLALGMEAALRGSLDARSTDVLVSEHGVDDFLASLVPENLAGTISSLPHVAAASPELARLAPVGDKRQAIIVGWPDTGFLWDQIEIVQGRRPSSADQRVVVLGEALAKTMQVRLGDTVEVFLEPFNVIGIARSPSVLNRSLVIVPLADLQDLTGREGRVTTIHVKLREGLDPDVVATATDHIRDVLESYSVESTEDAVRDNRMIRVARALSGAISAIAFVIGVLGVLNTQTMAMNERLGEIAMLSAIGWSRRRIVGAVMLEGLILTSAGGLIGLVAGVLATQAIAATPQLVGFLDPSPSATLLVAVAGAAVVLGAIGAFPPAWRATAGEPATFLRQR